MRALHSQPHPSIPSPCMAEGKLNAVQRGEVKDCIPNVHHSLSSFSLPRWEKGERLEDVGVKRRSMLLQIRL